jgi:hypothetical protein
MLLGLENDYDQGITSRTSYWLKLLSALIRILFPISRRFCRGDPKYSENSWMMAMSELDDGDELLGSVDTLPLYYTALAIIFVPGLVSTA